VANGVTVWHNGGTGGFSSSLFATPSTDVGAAAVVSVAGLANTLDSAMLAVASGRSVRPATVTYTDTAPDSVEAIVRSFLSDLEASDWNAAAEHVESTTRQALSADALAQAWTDLRTQLGPVTSVQAPTATTADGVTKCRTVLDFGPSQMAVFTAHDQTGAMVGVLVTEPNAPAPW